MLIKVYRVTIDSERSLFKDFSLATYFIRGVLSRVKIGEKSPAISMETAEMEEAEYLAEVEKSDGAEVKG